MPDIAVEVENLKVRVHRNADTLEGVKVEQARILGRLESAEASIDRIIHTSATTDQVNAVQTLLALKLDHLLEKHLETKRSITIAMRLLFLMFGGLAVALAYELVLR